MNFYAIGPLAASEVFQDHPYHMALAQYLYDAEYLMFMVRQSARGHKVVLDSGVYEGSAVDERQLLYWCKVLEPHAVILPDKPDDVKETLRLSLSFADKLDSLSGELRTLKWKVLHAEAGEDFLTSYQYDSRLFDGVCFSRLTTSFGLEECMAGWARRTLFIQRLKELKLWNPNCYHHALGMRDGSLRELEQLRNIDVDSCDSSAPIWRGVHGHKIGSNELPFNIDFDPFWSPTPSLCNSPLSIDPLAKENFQQVLDICASK